MAVRDARFDRRLFTGVKTTGIHCRQICPARTLRPANIIFFPTAAAAAHEAGFKQLSSERLDRLCQRLVRIDANVISFHGWRLRDRLLAMLAAKG